MEGKSAEPIITLKNKYLQDADFGSSIESRYNIFCIVTEQMTRSNQRTEFCEGAKRRNYPVWSLT